MLKILLLRIFGWYRKPNPQNDSITPTGISRTIVPQEYLDEVKEWDGDKFSNKIILPKAKEEFSLAKVLRGIK